MSKFDKYTKIDEYIDNIYGNFDNSDKDTKILKEEMRNHLYEKIEELKKQGLNEEESIQKALECFGQENSVVAEMSNVLNNRSIFTKMLFKAGAVVFVIGILFQFIGIFSNIGDVQYLSGDLIKNGFKNISYLIFMISLSIWDIAFYYYYFIKKQGMVLVAFITCDFVICVPLTFLWIYFPHHIIRSMGFILAITFIITLFLRIYYVKSKN
ncbi:permease prefix domain 1-containing protein [Clostridium thailandense]|uniref:permease prefix domain 1-containing protein n=1 Tax=Clostridium thailandense TaxID=2794346 RepID=UPI003989FED4